jgi:aryl-alcohol dehydrogenase-like predicted oxidoreductase
VQTRRLGNSGLSVSRLGLGTMTWGRDTDEHEAADQLRAFLDAGGSLIDTAALYGAGDSERVLGGLIGTLARRDEVVIATKGGLRVTEGGREVGCSRGALLRDLDGSLARLGVDHVDLWQVHVWDAATPIDETLSALDFAISSGRSRYVGISNYTGWQTAQAATIQSQWPGKAVLSSTQIEYSLLNRRVEDEVLPAAQALGMGVLAWSPLGRGVLTGKYRNGTPVDSRGASDHFSGFVAPYLNDSSRRIVDGVFAAAEGLGCSPLEIALAWVRDAEHVTSAIVGARTAAQLRGILTAEEIDLPDVVRAALNEVSDT